MQIDPTIDIGNLIKGIIGSVVRFLFAGIVGYLVERGIVSGEQGELLLPAITLGLITVAWAIWRKYRIQQRISVALGLPAGSTAKELDEAVKISRAA